MNSKTPLENFQKVAFWWHVKLRVVARFPSCIALKNIKIKNKNKAKRKILGNNKNKWNKSFPPALVVFMSVSTVRQQKKLICWQVRNVFLTVYNRLRGEQKWVLKRKILLQLQNFQRKGEISVKYATIMQTHQSAICNTILLFFIFNF